MMQKGVRSSGVGTRKLPEGIREDEMGKRFCSKRKDDAKNTTQSRQDVKKLFPDARKSDHDMEH